MLLIGGTTSTISFACSLAKSRSNLPHLDYQAYEVGKNIKTIGSIDNIEDFEANKGCKFFFYPKGTGRFDQKEIKDARGFSKGTNDSAIISKAEENKSKCAKNSFVYIEIP
ncbi:hypothetical protein [Candidatus Mycoplasma haematobovis]|nr:hypothetical protein [Candidatus Mycoplasma haematobovis]